MKTSQTCPKCSSKKLFVIDTFQMKDHEVGSHLQPLYVVATKYNAGPGMFGDNYKRVDAGSFEVWVCSGCGLTEWYATGVNDALAQLASEPESGVRFIDGGEPGVYR
jgi:predicted nucleic-acid-binding Zn-ribbon protein